MTALRCTLAVGPRQSHQSGFPVPSYFLLVPHYHAVFSVRWSFSAAELMITSDVRLIAQA